MTEQEAIDYIDSESPPWMEPVDLDDIAAICQGGCSSGAYMPAVTYYKAAETMAEHGDSVLDYLDQQLCGEAYGPEPGESWSGIAVYYLSLAVELWANSIEAHLESEGYDHAA